MNEVVFAKNLTSLNQLILGSGLPVTEHLRETGCRLSTMYGQWSGVMRAVGWTERGFLTSVFFVQPLFSYDPSL